MFTTSKLGAESEIRSRLAKLNTTADFLSALGGIPASRLSQSFRGIRPLANQDALRLLHLLDELDELVDVFKPVPIALTNPGSIRSLLETIRDQRRGTSSEAFCVRFGENYFTGFKGSPRVTFAVVLATAMDRIVAEKTAALLRGKFPGVATEIVKNPFASLDSLATELSEVWSE